MTEDPSLCQTSCAVSAKYLGLLKVAASMTYHPQTDGQTEWVNQEIKQFLRLFVNQRQDDWYDWILIAKSAYND